MISLFCGFDERESDGFHVFCHSVITRASQPVSIIPLASMGLQHGTNAFTVSRFLVPQLMDYKGHAIFADASDMLMLGDVAELDSLFDPAYAVQVVKHPAYQTKHRTKYRGTDMECPNLDYKRKNWSSVMVLNNAHPAWLGLNPEGQSVIDLLQFKHLDDAAIGELPDEWNRLVDEGHPVEGAKVCHWTAGIPIFHEYHDAPGADLWRAERDKAMCHGR